MKVKGLAKSNASWNLISTMSGTAIAVLWWKEELTQKELLGIALGCIGLYLMDGEF
jgi:multidrug transporter EmrE-like cation transporter